jgi:hypothetical protein
VRIKGNVENMFPSFLLKLQLLMGKYREYFKINIHPKCGFDSYYPICTLVIIFFTFLNFLWKFFKAKYIKFITMILEMGNMIFFVSYCGYKIGVGVKKIKIFQLLVLVISNL